MTIRQRKGFRTIAVFVMFAMAQLYVQLGLAEPSPANSAAPLPQAFVARLTTRRDQPINVNGASAATGATILTDAVIETPADVGATINLGALGTLDLGPNTKIKLEFDRNGKVRIVLFKGCFVMGGKKNTDTEVVLEDGTVAAKSDKKKGGGLLNLCFVPGASGPTQGNATDVGAAVGSTGVAAAGGGGGPNLLVGGILIGAFLGVGLPLALRQTDRGTNPSPSTPTSSPTPTGGG